MSTPTPFSHNQEAFVGDYVEIAKRDSVNPTPLEVRLPRVSVEGLKQAARKIRLIRTSNGRHSRPV